MMANFLKSFIVPLVLLMSSCQSQHHESVPAKEINVDELPLDIFIPTKLWEQIQTYSQTSELLPKGKEEAAADANDGFGSRGTILFSPVTVILKENNPEVLEAPEIKITLPRGGGQIDLADYLGKKTGSFFVRFEWPEWAEVKSVQSFYVSRGKKRKLDDQVYGAGCNKYLTLTSKMQKLNSGNGIKVNSTRDRHISVLAGHFIFAGKRDSQTFLNQVTFIDSKRTDLICDGKKTI